MSACNQCPLTVVLDVSEKLIQVYEDVHGDPARALGGIALTRKAHELVSSNLNCNGPTVNQNGQLDCPLRETVYGARGMATSPWQPHQFVVQLEKMTPETTEKKHSPGQYL